MAFMTKWKRTSKGFALIASLLLLLLLSAIAVGLMSTVNGAGHASNNDLEANRAFYGAESGMEKLTADVASLYQQKMAPTQSDLNTLASSSAPSAAMVGAMTYQENVSFASVDKSGNPITSTTVLSSGPYSGLTAEIIPITLQVSAFRPSGASVNMTRGIEVALIPVFQFGVFSDSDLSYFAGPPFTFAGRVHTNGNLYLAANSGPLILGSQVTAVGQVVRDRLANNYSSSGNYQGDVYLPNATGGCDSFAANNGSGNAPSSCINMGPDSDNSTNDASWSGGIPLGAGAANTTKWSQFSSSLNGFIQTGVAPLALPFVQGNTTPIQIIRKPQTTTESVTSPLGASREFNKAAIRILLGDNEAELHPSGSANDANDIQLENVGGVSVTGTGTSYFATANSSDDPHWVAPRCKPGSNAQAPYPTYPESSCTVATNPPPANTTWPLVRGWLRVEYLDSTSGNWVGVTKEWLGYGFAKSGTIARSTPGADTAGHPNAILIFQELADRNGDGKITNGNVQVQIGTDSKGNPIYQTVPESPSMTLNPAVNFYPINFYDEREGFPRDSTSLTGTQCSANGIMNAVELDVGNLQQWLLGKGAYSKGSGTKVNSTNENGYVLYFSDRRGMEPDPNATPTANVTSGESGLEDDINSNVATGNPDGKLDSSTTPSPEDVDQNGVLDNWGGVNVGDGFGLNSNSNPPNPYPTVDCMNAGRQNWVSGARHVLRLVDGAYSYLPMPGFTVASENPVYVQGNYNSNASDTVWNTPSVDEAQTSATSIVADAVTLLSSSWSDLNDMANPSNLGGRNATTTYYRMAIAAGKNINFPQPSGTAQDFGTDGGVHNFLRYIENWGGSGVSLYYRGSLISFFYSQYATGIYKCCTLVYSPPNRVYSFDTDFLTPSKLPPGTPMLQDVENLTYWQSFTPCTTQSGNACSN
jgi:Tfp pilus assembly protein PilX